MKTMINDYLGKWLLSYLLQVGRRLQPSIDDSIHVLLCIVDHFEPSTGSVCADRAQSRVEHWAREYPHRFATFCDSDGMPPRHSFFYPLEQYDSSHIDVLAELCRKGFGEVEVHLHHDHDTTESLRAELLSYKETLSQRHGLLARHRITGDVCYAFIHGNWALDNSRPDGRWCGVNNELEVLRETGCYADFTMPSAPSPTQTRKINSIYYACDDPVKPKSHDWGVDVGRGPAPSNGLMMIQGPLLLNWRRRKWGLLPRLENGCLQGSQPPSLSRLDLWLRAHVQIHHRRDWFFVKLHTHGAPEENSKILLGEPMVRFHQDLARLADENPQFQYHYVTARELYNLARAAEGGWAGSVDLARDHELLWEGSPKSSLGNYLATEGEDERPTGTSDELRATEG